MKRTLAVVLAGGEGERLSILSSVRAKPAVPFGGKYRIIDFTLQQLRELRHRPRDGPDPVQPPLAERPHRPRAAVGPRPQHGRRPAAAAVHRARPRGRVVPRHGRRGPPEPREIEHQPDDTVLILAGDHIYKMDYQPFVAFHRRHRADVTIAVRRVPLADATRMGILAMDDERPRRRVAGEAPAAEERPRVDGRLRLHEARAAALARRDRGPTSART